MIMKILTLALGVGALLLARDGSDGEFVIAVIMAGFGLGIAEMNGERKRDRR